jgi:DNA-binding NtrC family response regulator
MTSRDYDPDRIATARQDRVPLPQARGVRIEAFAGPTAPTSVRFDQQTVTIGRAPGVDVPIADPEVSSYHVEVTSTDVGIRVRDLGSLNGTFYERARIADAIVPSGASIVIGRSSLRLHLDAEFQTFGSDSASFGGLRGASDRMRALFAVLERVAKTDLSVLFEGPTGTGKELAARAIHDAGPRAGRPFVVLDCAAIPGTLAESILFGHEKGAFTGANERNIGAFEAAHGGTIFLDEIGELEPSLQPKLLRVLEQRTVVRVGSTRPIPVDLRVVSATLRDLRTMINEGRFREDLYYRLAHARVVVPSLRERPDDVPLLVKHFLRNLPQDTPCARAIAPEALEELASHEYPGNVRELKNTVSRVAMLAAGGVITQADLSFGRMLGGRRDAPAPAPSPEDDESIEDFKDTKRTLIEEFERAYLERLMARTGGNLSRASALARIERHHLRDLTRKYGLRAKDGGR